METQTTVGTWTFFATPEKKWKNNKHFCNRSLRPSFFEIFENNMKTGTFIEFQTNYNTWTFFGIPIISLTVVKFLNKHILNNFWKTRTFSEIPDFFFEKWQTKVEDMYVFFKIMNIFWFF